MNTRFHVGVLGTGDWSRVHLTALAASPHVACVTLAGRNHAALAQLAHEFPIVTRTLAPHALIDDPQIDLVHIVLPHHLHSEYTLAALAAGKHVICEKPAGTRLADFDRALVLAKAQHRRLLVVMNQLYNPLLGQLRTLIDTGTIGRPFLSVENGFSDASRNYRDLTNWRNTIARAGGGILIDGAFHLVYRHLFVLAAQGQPAWVLADTPQLAVSSDGKTVTSKGEDFVSIVVGYDSPLRIQWAHGWTLAGAPRRARQAFLAGTAGTLELTDIQQQPLLLHRANQTEAIDVPATPWTGPETTHACLLDYLECLATGRPVERASTALARLTLSIVLAAYDSGRLGQRVMLA